jgi:hypothetical protein
MEAPDMEAKAILKRLQSSGYGEYPDGQLRTLAVARGSWRRSLLAVPEALYLSTELPVLPVETQAKATASGSVSLKALQRGGKGFRGIRLPMEAGTPTNHRPHWPYIQVRQTFEECVRSFRIT